MIQDKSTSVKNLTNMPENKLLSQFSRRDIEILSSAMRVGKIRPGAVLWEPGEAIEWTYFPHSGVLSLLAVMPDGRVVETATIGREGGIGILGGFGQRHTINRAIVQTEVVVTRISVAALSGAVSGSDHLAQLLMRYTEVLLRQMQSTAACNATHPIVSRLARWILQTSDKTDGGKISLTQEFMSQMLGVRRSTVSEIAHKIQDNGIIQYSRGVVVIKDRVELEKLSCNCYEHIKNVAERQLM